MQITQRLRLAAHPVSSHANACSERCSGDALGQGALRRRRRRFLGRGGWCRARGCGRARRPPSRAQVWTPPPKACKSSPTSWSTDPTASAPEASSAGFSARRIRTWSSKVRVGRKEYEFFMDLCRCPSAERATWEGGRYLPVDSVVACELMSQLRSEPDVNA